MPPTLPIFDTGLHSIPQADLTLEYLTIVKDLKTKTPPCVVKGHLFKLMRPALGREKDLREKLGEIRGGDEALGAYLEIVKEIKLGMDVSFSVKPTLNYNNKYSP